MVENKAKYRFKHEMYTDLQKKTPEIYAAFVKKAEALKITDEEKFGMGLTGAISQCHGPLRDDVEAEMAKMSRKVVPCTVLAHELRGIVKSYYGDEYDCCPVNTCEAALLVSFDTLVTPPFSGRGESYRCRYIAPYERHIHHQGGYGTPFPPKYKDIFADRGCTSGELGFIGKRQYNTDAIYVPLEGARYEVHGIRHAPCPLLLDTDPKKSLESIHKIAKRHAEILTGITSLGYSTPGYGYGVKDESGTPELQKGLAKLAKKYNIPYIVDNAWGVPFIGTDIRKNGADLMLYSMDKASGCPTVGLIIGKEEPVTQIRRALGMHGARSGSTASYGKAAYVSLDPGKEALTGMIAALKTLLEKPEIVTKQVDEFHKIIVEETDRLPEAIKKNFVITKDYNSAAVEINYQKAWDGEGLGYPIFSIEDMYAGSNILQEGMKKIGIFPTIMYDANCYLSAGLGTLDNKGQLIEGRARKMIRAMCMLIETVGEFAGII
jgi:aminotransferase class V